MEFGVVAFGAVLSVALSKLCSVKEKKLKTDATLISNKLGMIRAIMEDHALRGGKHVSRLQRVCIAQLRRLAYDIEDCIDCFHANKTTPEDFAIQLCDLKDRTEDMKSEIIGLAAQAQQSSMGPTEQQVAAHVPVELQDPTGKRNCLLYLCLFPPNHDVRTKPLIRRWLAEGLVLGERAAVQNLGFFIGNSNIINSISIQRSNNGKVKTCQPTNVMRHHITQWSLSEDFMLVCDGTAQLEAESARRLSVHPSADGELILPEDLTRLRTLAVFPASETSLASYEDVLKFGNYKVLRVLDLKECAELSAQHLRDLSKQVLMKYLSINLGSIDPIARQIGYLEQLETLDLRGSETVTVFKEVLLLPKLKHLFGKFQLYVFAWVPSNLEKFLKDKSVLETLAGFVIGASQGFPQLMSRMRRLRKVKIWCESKPSKKNLSYISGAIAKFIREGTEQPDLNRSLSVDFQGCSREFVHTIHTDAGGILASLKLRGNLSRFPQFVAQLRAVEELCLCSTGLSWESILDGLRSVSGLKYLKLIEDNLGRLNILSEAEHLIALERIYVLCKQKLEVTITVPHLVSLHILCQDPQFIPEIKLMPKLKEVALYDQDQATIKVALEEAAKCHPSKPKVSFIKEV